MKWLIASDIHGSALYCEKLLNRFHAEDADRILLLGDILYHGPRNNLPGKYAPKDVISMLNPLSDRIFSVRGNCDTEVDQMVLTFPVLADYAILDLGDFLIYATHGHVYNDRHLPPLRPGDILLQGHTHVPKLEVFDTHISMNPGSVSIPKESSANSYMALENGLFLWKDLDGGTYREFSVSGNAVGTV